MKDPQALFNASPEAFFEELGNRFRDLDARLDRLGERVDRLAEVIESHLTTGLPIARAAAERRDWAYDVRMPNIYFDNVFDLETGTNYVKRWVNASGRIAGTLALPRDTAFAFEVIVCDFVSPEAGRSFSLSVDNARIAWEEAGPKLFRAIVPPAPAARGLAFSLGVDPALCPPDKDVSFSFASISVHPAEGAGVPVAA
jgi:hypothetical protein